MSRVDIDDEQQLHEAGAGRHNPARLHPPPGDVAAARLALGCPQVLRMLARARDPLTFSRIARKMV